MIPREPRKELGAAQVAALWRRGTNHVGGVRGLILNVTMYGSRRAPSETMSRHHIPAPARPSPTGTAGRAGAGVSGQQARETVSQRPQITPNRS